MQPVGGQKNVLLEMMVLFWLHNYQKVPQFSYSLPAETHKLALLNTWQLPTRAREDMNATLIDRGERNAIPPTKSVWPILVSLTLGHD